MMKIFFSILFVAQISEARIFDMKETGFGGFFSATQGSSSVGDDYFVGESTATEFSKGFKTNQGGEFGFIYNTGSVSWLFGLEIIKPPKTRGVASTSGTANYSYSAEVSAYAPKFGLELVFYQDKNYRVFANGTFGTGSLTTKTQYTGLTIAPNTDFSIEGKGSANLMSYSIGTEFHWTDNTTVVLALGQRKLNFSKIKYLDDVATSFNGAHSKGDQIKKVDGSDLEYDFSNTYLTLGLRFWIQ